MDWFQWFLIIFGATLILSVIVVGLIIMYKLRRKKVVFATVFLKSGGQGKFFVKRDSSKTTTYENCIYTFDELAVRKTPFKDFIYYKEGINAPLRFDNVQVESNMSPEELKTILEDDLVSQLFSDSAIETLKLLVIITLVAVILNFIVSIFGMFNGVTIKDNEANRAFLMNITRTVIIGG